MVGMHKNNKKLAIFLLFEYFHILKQVAGK